MFMSLLSYGEEGVVVASAFLTVRRHLPFAVVTKNKQKKNRYYCREFGPPPAVFIETKHVFFFPKQGLFLTVT